jgi:hypothetical protein
VLPGDLPGLLLLEELQFMLDEGEVGFLCVFGVGGDEGDAFDGVLLEVGELGEELEGVGGVVVDEQRR